MHLYCHDKTDYSLRSFKL